MICILNNKGSLCSNQIYQLGTKTGVYFILHTWHILVLYSSHPREE